MSFLREDRSITLTMNPDELRSVADKMEKDFPKKIAGDSTFICVLASLGDLTVDLHAEQRWFQERDHKKRMRGC